MLDGIALRELLDRDPPDAWNRLVEECSDLILGVISRYTRDTDSRMDAYLFVLEELSANDYRRLRQFVPRPGTPHAALTTWLKLVVRNLYFDWFRREHGRKMLPKEVEKLGPVERRAFKLVYWDGHSAQEAFEVLRGQDSNLRFGEFIRRLGQVDASLSSINHARIRRDFERGRPPVSLEEERDNTTALEARLPGRTPTPEDDLAVAERLGALWNLVAELPHADQVLIRLRFFEGLTARQIAASIGAPDPMEIYRRVDRVCLELRRRAAAVGIESLLLEGDPADLADSGHTPGGAGNPGEPGAGEPGAGEPGAGEPGDPHASR